MATPKLDTNLLKGTYESAFKKWKGAYTPTMAPIKTELSKTPIGSTVSKMPVGPPAVKFVYSG